MSQTQVIVVGGGLSGLSAAHTVLENGGNVVIIDKMPFFGGNSTKATSGINGAGTATQRAKGVADTPEVFENDTRVSAKEGYNAGLVRVLTHQSGPAVEWLIERFGLDLSLISRLGGHSFERTHRGKAKFPGMTITTALMEKFEEIAKHHPDRARVLMKARVDKLLTDSNGAVIGVEYETKEGQRGTELGPVIISTGGFAADFTPNSLLASVSKEWRTLSAWKDVPHLPDLLDLPTTNGVHCTGDGIKLSTALGADTVDMEAVQVHPTGLIHPDDPDAKVRFLAAEALRGVGGLLLTADGERFCDELGKRDYVTALMWRHKGPFYLVLNSKASHEIEWHCKHYKGRGLMRSQTGAELAKTMGIPVAKLQAEFEKYNDHAKNNTCPFGKKFFHNVPFKVDDEFHVALVGPVVHYTMGGLAITPDAEVKKGQGVIPGLWAAGEVMGGVHGKNRLGGNSLLDCVVYGRVSGRSAARYLLHQSLESLRSGGGVAAGRVANIAGHLAPINISVHPSEGRLTIDVSFDGASKPSAERSAGAPSTQSAAASVQHTEDSPTRAEEQAHAPAAPANQSYTLAEIAKHNTKEDCWVAVNGVVLDVTKFMHEHPGGSQVIMLYAGKDASEEFNMLHNEDVVQKYASEHIKGKLA